MTYLGVIILITFIGEAQTACSWSTWSSCSRSCGGGTQSKTHTCGSSWWGRSRTTVTSRQCNKHCYDGGYYIDGSCSCPPRRTGICCDSIKRCYQDNGGCVETCTPNSYGSTCGCRHSGFKLASDGRSCTDIDECSMDLCKHNCQNTRGSFVCSCRYGYTLDSNKRTCTDNDECTADHVECEQLCRNTPGTYTCDCRDGYKLKSDGISCEDIDECKIGNGGCSNICRNERGSYSCECPTGFQLDKDKKTCIDIDECSITPYKCQQICQNTIGSYKCGCRIGFRISTDDKSCQDIDDCIGVTCYNKGTCNDGINSFTCNCPAGLTGKLCQDDINECTGVLNGGCEDICTNKFGSFNCECTGNKTLSSDGLYCTGGTSVSIFESQHIFQELLPRGCSTIQLARCTEGNNISLLLSSTSQWFKLKSDPNIKYTLGIVFVELEDLSLPVSLTGVVVLGEGFDFSLTIGVIAYAPSQGLPIGQTKLKTEQCWSFDISPRSIHDFLQSSSFLKSFLGNIERSLPKWISFTMSATELFGLHDLKTEFQHGSDIMNDAWCKGAPLLHERLYTVFKFGGSFSLSIYGDEIKLPKALAGQKYCFIIDICQDYGGSFFFMLPEESRDVLENFQIFKDLSDKYNLHIQPRGIGISLKKHVRVQPHSRELTLWNGDRTFTYSVFHEANLWIGGDVVLDHGPFFVHAESDLYIAIPSFESLLTSTFSEEWSLFVQTDIGADIQISLELFGKDFDIRFKDIGIANIDIYASLGGQNDRTWCGKYSNPPGFFFSAMVDVNPFQGIPILEDFVFDLTARLYVFMTSDPTSDIVPNEKTNILTDILDLEDFLKKFLNTTMTVADTYGIVLLSETLSILEDIEKSTHSSLSLVHRLIDTLKRDTLNAITYDWKGAFTTFEIVWTSLTDLISDDVNRFFDSVEFQTRVTNYNLTTLFKAEINAIKTKLIKAENRISRQIMQIVNNYKGVGFRFTADLKIFILHFGLVDFEAVHSVDRLGSCGKFEDAFNLFKGERSFKLLGKTHAGYELTPFLKTQVGGGVGMAFGIDSFKFLTQIHINANLLGIRASADLFVNNNGLYFYMEGNLWSFFKAGLKVSAEHGKEWSYLELKVHGELLADSDGDKDFHDSYLDALRRAIQSIGDAATKRMEQAQHALTQAQSGLTSAQNWLESKKKDVRALNSKFDEAIKSLERAKDTVEEAKGPFNAAIAKLNAAQRNVNNLCRIKHCNSICIPGLKCKICRTGGWIKVSYPCCHWTNCLISIPNPICVAMNIACMAIRGVAYVALEAAKIFVRVPMLALDVAKVALSVAQVVVDRSRVVLDIAIAALDVAKFGLDAAKGVLEVAKQGIEAVKQVMKLGFKVLDMIVDWGLKSLVDLKNCMFDITLSTKDLPVFSVSCDVNVLRLGWTNIKFGVNFNRPLQSLWHAAKEVVKATTDKLGHLLFGRKRRDLLHESMFRTHSAFRLARELHPDFNLTESELNETIDIVFQTPGFRDDAEGDDYDNRVGVFKAKCERYQTVVSYLSEANGVLFGIADETNTMLDSASRMTDDIEDFDIENIRRDFTLENTGINPDVALRDYNLTVDELHAALEDANSTLRDDQLLQETTQATKLSKELVENSTSSLTNIQITDQWLLAMDNVTREYFPKETCVSFLDCAHYSMSELLDVYYAEDFENISEITSTLSDIEDTFLILVGNSSLQIKSVYNFSKTIDALLKHLDEMNPLCSSAPAFLSPLVNQTVVRNTSTVLFCNVTGKPDPTIWWYENGELLPEEHSKTLGLTNLNNSESTQYMCVAGNVVANLSSRAMFLNVKDFEDPVDSVVVSRPSTDANLDSNIGSSAGTTNTEDANNHPEKSEKIQEPSPTDSDEDIALIVGVTVGCVVCLVAGVVVWRLYVRYKFRKANTMGSLMSMNIIRPSAANVRFNSASRERSMTAVEPLDK